MSCSKRFYLSTRKRILTQATETNTVMLLITRPCFLNNTHTHTRFKAVFQDYFVSRYQKGTTNLDFTEARDIEWQLHQLGHVQVCTSLQTDNHHSTPTSQAGWRSFRTTNSVTAN